MELDNDQAAVSGQGNFEQQGTGEPVGQPPEGTEQPVGEPQAQQPTTEQPATGKESVEITPEKYAELETNYKNLQTEFGKRNESDKELRSRFEQFGGIDKVHEHVSYLVNNPRFTEFLKQEQQSQVIGGVDISGYDQEQKDAINLVQQMATQIAQTEIQKAMKNKVDPLANSYKERLMDEHFAKMTEKYPNWREQEKQMETLADKLPIEVQDNPTLADVEALYLRSIVADGKIEKFGADLYQQKLEQKKAQSTEQPPTTTGQTQEKRATTIAEALRRSKKTHGVTGEFGVQ
jgi:hypothetical protein